MIILLSFVMCFRSIGRFYVNNVYICTSITNIVYMSDRQQFIIDCTSLIPVIGTLVLIKIANEQMVTMVAAYVLCGELLGVLISRILRLYYILMWLSSGWVELCFGCGIGSEYSPAIWGDRASAASVDRTSCNSSYQMDRRLIGRS